MHETNLAIRINSIMSYAGISTREKTFNQTFNHVIAVLAEVLRANSDVGMYTVTAEKLSREYPVLAQIFLGAIITVTREQAELSHIITQAIRDDLTGAITFTFGIYAVPEGVAEVRAE